MYAECLLLRVYFFNSLLCFGLVFTARLLRSAWRWLQEVEEEELQLLSIFSRTNKIKILFKFEIFRTLIVNWDLIIFLIQTNENVQKVE